VCSSDLYEVHTDYFSCDQLAFGLWQEVSGVSCHFRYELASL